MCVCVSVCLCVCESVCLCVCLFTFEVPVKRIFALTPRIFRASESLGGKWNKVDSDLKTFTNKGCKIVVQNKVWFGNFFW